MTKRNTRNEILISAKKLFYEKGYTNTYYKDICEDAGINPGTLHYYFKSKEEIAGSVISEISNNIDCRIKEIFPDMHIESQRTLLNIIYYDLLYYNESFKRFYLEIGQTNILCRYSIGMTISYEKEYFDAYRARDDKRFIAPYAYMHSYLQCGVLTAFLSGELELTYLEVIDLLCVTMFSQLFRKSQDEIYKIIAKTRHLARTLDYSMSGSFEIHIDHK